MPDDFRQFAQGFLSGFAVTALLIVWTALLRWAAGAVCRPERRTEVEEELLKVFRRTTSRAPTTDPQNKIREDQERGDLDEQLSHILDELIPKFLDCYVLKGREVNGGEEEES